MAFCSSGTICWGNRWSIKSLCKKSSRGFHNFNPTSLKIECVSTNKIAHIKASKSGEALIPAETSFPHETSLEAFFLHPKGRKTVLNEHMLQKVEVMDDGIYRCYLPSVEWLSFSVSPVLDLRLEVYDGSCNLELLNCRFSGSGPLSGEKQRFSATMSNKVFWGPPSSTGEQKVTSNVKVSVDLEVYTPPFTFLPLSAIETPGNKMLDVLLSQLLPVFLDSLTKDYLEWVKEFNSTPTSEKVKSS